MNFKISEKPVILMNTGKVLGTLKGLIYKDNKVTFLYCKFSNKYIYIPIQDVSIGSDAILLKATEDMNMLLTDAVTKVYTENGQEVGTVNAIEMDDCFHITGIIVNDDFIDIDNVLHMENIIIIKNDKRDMKDPVPAIIDAEAEVASSLQLNERATESPTESPTKSTETLEEISEESQEVAVTSEELDVLPTESTEVIEEIDPLSIENIAIVEEVDSHPTDSENNPNDHEEELAIEIDERYSYLCGKKLLESITILKETYEKGTLVDAALIQFAINNNAIVKVIMNTED